MKLTHLFEFEASHQLKNAYSKKCESLHGHSFKLFVTIEGKVNSKTVMVTDLGKIEKIVKKNVIDILDHCHLNAIFEVIYKNDVININPTMEFIILWVWDNLKSHLPLLSELTLWETSTSYCTYNGGE